MKTIQIFIFGLAVLLASTNGYGAECTVISLDNTTQSENVLNRNLIAAIGDSNSIYFKPQLQISAWNDECTFTINLFPDTTCKIDSVSTYTVNNSDGIDIKLDNNIRQVIYRRADGNLEWELILDRPPTTNRFEFDFDSNGLLFFYQDTSLLDSSLRANSIIPDSTIFSWAVFHTDHRNNWRMISGTDTTFMNYGTGKAFHIFRPKAFDRNKFSSWCQLDIDTLEKKLILAVPEEFLKSADYPVTVDPTIGETSTGLWFTNTTNLLYSLDYTHAAPTEDGQLNKMYLYSYRSNASSACSIRGYVYDYDDTLANCDLIASSDIIAVTNGTTSGDAQWNEMNIGGTIYSSSEYTPAFRCNHNNLMVGYGFGSPGHVKYLTLSNWTAPATLEGANDFGNHWACYCEYTIETEVSGRRRLLIGGR